jgi:hypothetical protein
MATQQYGAPQMVQWQEELFAIEQKVVRHFYPSPPQPLLHVRAQRSIASASTLHSSNSQQGKQYRRSAACGVHLRAKHGVNAVFR